MKPASAPAQLLPLQAAGQLLPPNHTEVCGADCGRQAEHPGRNAQQVAPVAHLGLISTSCNGLHGHLRTRPRLRPAPDSALRRPPGTAGGSSGRRGIARTRVPCAAVVHRHRYIGDPAAWRPPGTASSGAARRKVRPPRARASSAKKAATGWQREPAPRELLRAYRWG